MPPSTRKKNPCILVHEREKRTEADPLAEHLSIGDLDEGDLVLGAESDNKLLVGLLLATLVEDTHVSLTAVEGLGSLTQTTGKTVVDQGDAEDTLQSIEDGHLAGASVSGNLDLIGGGNRGVGNGLFSVRLYQLLVSLLNLKTGGRFPRLTAGVFCLDFFQESSRKFNWTAHSSRLATLRRRVDLCANLLGFLDPIHADPSTNLHLVARRYRLGTYHFDCYCVFRGSGYGSKSDNPRRGVLSDGDWMGRR